MGAKPFALPPRGPALPGSVAVFQAAAWHGRSDAAKLRALRDMAETYAHDPRMRYFTVDVLRKAGAQQRDYSAQAAALLRYVQEAIYYTNEAGEQLQSPWVTIEKRNGDCDDMSILLAAMAGSIRLPWRFALAGSDGGIPARWLEPYADGPVRIPGLYQLQGDPPQPRRTPPRSFSAHHIYVQLGWPPFQPREWQSAEVTVKGCPLGHDVVMHGKIVDRHLRGRGEAVSLPELAGVPGPGASLGGPSAGGPWNVRSPGHPPASPTPYPPHLAAVPQGTAITPAMRLSVAAAPGAAWAMPRRASPAPGYAGPAGAYGYPSAAIGRAAARAVGQGARVSQDGEEYAEEEGGVWERVKSIWPEVLSGVMVTVLSTIIAERYLNRRARRGA